MTPIARTAADAHRDTVCLAAMRFIAARRGSVVTQHDFPDKRERQRPAVDLWFELSSGVQVALEHTLVESFPGQIQDSRRFVEAAEGLEKSPPAALPSGSRYQLIFPVGAFDGIRDYSTVRAALEEWIARVGPALSPRMRRVRNNVLTATPPGVPFEVTLLRSTDGAAGSPARLLICRASPSDIESKRRARLTAALEKKCPKLEHARGLGAVSILLLESDDFSLACEDLIADALGASLGTHAAPDEVYVVQTGLKEWLVTQLREGTRDLYDLPDPGPHDLSMFRT